MLDVTYKVADAVGLADEDRGLVHSLVHLWHVKRHRNLVRHDYYTMHNRLKDLGISIPPSLRTLDAACGWGKKAVDVMVEHSKFDGWTCESEQAQAILDEVMRREKMRTKYRKAATSALEQCFCLFFVSKTANGAFYRTFETFFITSVIYFVMTFSVTRFLRWIERKMDGPQNYAIHGSQTVPDVELLKKGGAEDE